MKGKMVNNSDDLAINSAAGATVLMLGQIFTKLMTFVINQALIRFISSHIFGVTSFMEVLISCALFYSREGIRLTCQRINSSDFSEAVDKKSNASANVKQSIVNLSILPVILGIPIMLALNTQLPDLSSYKYHRASTWLLFSSTILELASEPFYNLNQHTLNFKLRTKIESLSLVMKCLSHFAIIVYLHNHHRSSGYYVLAFTIAQFVYTTTIFTSYLYNYIKNTNHKDIKLMISKIYTDKETYYYFDKTAMRYWISLIFQLIFKYALTEGDQFLLSFLCSTDEQGIFALISNYGSLIARLLFAPLEETLRMILTKSFSTSSKSTIVTRKLQLISVLTKICKFYIYLSLIIVIFAPLNSRFLLTKMIGEKWTSSNTLLFTTFRTYWAYIPFLAVNGILEATFYSITDDPSEIFTYSKVMVACSVMYFLALTVLIKYFQMSLIGLILANILNMCLRIFYCTKTLSRFLAVDDLRLSTVLKDKNYLYAISFAALVYLTHIRLIGNEVHNCQEFLASGALAAFLLCTFFTLERKLLVGTVVPLAMKKQQ